MKSHLRISCVSSGPATVAPSSVSIVSAPSSNVSAPFELENWYSSIPETRNFSETLHCALGKRTGLKYMLRQRRDHKSSDTWSDHSGASVDMNHAIEEGPEEEIGEHLPEEPIGEERLS